MIKQRVGVLVSTAHQPSLCSPRIAPESSPAAALARAGHDVIEIDVDQELDLALRRERVAVAFLACPGHGISDGSVQGLLETMRIPYTGSSVIASGLAAHRGRCKELLRLRNLPTPAYYLRPSTRAVGADVYHGDFGFPCLVKPVRTHSGFLPVLATSFHDLSLACDDAGRYDDELLIERKIDGTAAQVAILDDRALGVVCSSTPGTDAAPISNARSRGVVEQALGAARAFGCRGTVLVDLIVSESGNEFVTGVDTMPRLDAGLPFAEIGRRAGLDHDALCAMVLDGAALGAGMRYGERRRTSRPFWGTERRGPNAITH